jgi:hypothetical protein
MCKYVPMKSTIVIVVNNNIDVFTKGKVMQLATMAAGHLHYLPLFEIIPLSPHNLVEILNSV